jgi:hypothetical protein
LCIHCCWRRWWSPAGPSSDKAEAGAETVVEFIGNPGTSTYDELLRDARHACGRNVGSMGGGKLEVLQADKQ